MSAQGPDSSRRHPQLDGSPSLSPCPGGCVPPQALREWLRPHLQRDAVAFLGTRAGRECGAWVQSVAKGTVIYVHSDLAPGDGERSVDCFGWAMPSGARAGLEALAVEVFAAGIEDLSSYEASIRLGLGGLGGPAGPFAAFLDSVRQRERANRLTRALTDCADRLVFTSAAGSPVRWTKGFWLGQPLDWRSMNGVVVLRVGDPGGEGAWYAEQPIEPESRDRMSVSVEEFHRLFRDMVPRLRLRDGAAQRECPFSLRPTA